MEFFVFVACVTAVVALVRTARLGAFERRIAMAERDAIANETALRATVRKFNEHMTELEDLRRELAQLQTRRAMPAPRPAAAPEPAPMSVVTASRITPVEPATPVLLAPSAPRPPSDAVLLDAPVPAMVWLAPEPTVTDVAGAGAALRIDSVPVTSLPTEAAPTVAESAEPAAAEYVRTAPIPESEPPFEAGIDWEQWLGVRGAAVLGGIVLALAALLFFKYSIEHSLISPSLRVVLGVLTGLGCIVGASRLPARYAPSVNAVTGGGVVVLYASFWAARALYGLVPPMVAFLLMALTTTAACVLAVRRNSLLIALLGVVGGFATPLLLASGKDNPLGLFGYVLLLDMGLMYMAYRRRWAVLMVFSLAGTMFMQALWMGLKMGPERTVLGLAILGVFAVLFVVVGVKLGDSDDQENAAMWRWSLRAGLLSPFLFLLYFASNVDLGPHLYPTAIFALMICLGACWVARRASTPWLPLAAAGGALATVAGWALTHTLVGQLMWELVACAFALTVPYVWLDESTAAGSGQPAAAHWERLALFALCMGFLLLQAGVSIAGVEPALWPAGLGVALMALLLYRAAGIDAARMAQLVAAAVSAMFLSAHYLAHRYHTGAIGLATHLWLTAGVAAAFLALALLRRAESVRVVAHHAAAAFAAISLVMVAVIGPDLDGAPPGVVLGPTAAIVLVGVFAATRLGDGRWVLGLAAAAVFAQSMWTFAQQSLDASAGARGFYMQTALVCFVVGWPFAARRAFANDSFAWMASALAGPLWFFSLRALFIAAFTDAAIGLLPVGLGALSLAALMRVRTHGPEGAAKRKSAIVWQSAIALSFLSVAIPLQLSNEWVTIGWAVEALALVLLWRKLDHSGLKWWAFALAASVVLRLVANSEVLAYHARGSMPVLNWVFYTYWVPVAALVGSAALLQPLEATRARTWEPGAYAKGIPLVASFMAGGAVAVFFVWINLGIADYFGVTRTLSLQFERLPARDLATSISWALYAVLLLAIGMARSIRALRWVSLAFLLLTIGKVFLYDLAELKDLYRVLSLVGLAVSLIGVSLAYQRFVFSADKERR